VGFSADIERVFAAFINGSAPRPMLKTESSFIFNFLLNVLRVMRIHSESLPCDAS
jgi:hypothetical protein